MPPQSSLPLLSRFWGPRRGYEYDCTVFPNALNPLARAYFFATSRLSKDEKEQRKALFGNVSRPTAK